MMRRKCGIAGRIAMAALVVVSLFSMVGSAVALSNSGGGSWQYYKEITVSENSGSILTAYQVLVQLSSSNFPTNARSDGADIRFTDATNNELSYWIESWDYAGRSAKIWIKVPNIPASAATTIRMYYGNPSAGSSSNGDATFELYDDFSGTNLDVNKWDGSGTISISNGEISLYGLARIKSKAEFGENILEETRSKAGGGVGYYIGFRDGADTKGITVRGSNGADPFWWDAGNGIAWSGGGVAPYDNVYHLWRLERNGVTSAKVYQDGSIKVTITTNLPSGNLKAFLLGGEYPTGTYYYTYVDWVRIRKYASTEPTLTLGAEQIVPPPTAIIDPTGDIFAWSSGSPTSGPSYIDIVSAEITQGDPTHITLKIKVNGNIPSFGWQGYYFYLDTDRNSGTGFSNIGSNDIGVDYEVGVRGNSGSPPIFTEIRRNGVAQGSGIPITYTISGDTISTTISLADIGNPTSFYWIALTTDGVSINDKVLNSGHSTLSLSPLPTTVPPTTVPPTTVPPTTVPPTTVPPTTVPPTTVPPTTVPPTTVPPTSTSKPPMLTVSYTTSKENPEVGEEVLIAVTVLNKGEGAAKNIRLTEQLPSSVTVSYIDGATSNTPNLVTWNGELAPNRAHAILHTLKIVEKKSIAIPVTIIYEDEAGKPGQTSATIYVGAQATATPTPEWTKAPEPTVQEVKVKAPGFTGLLVLIGLVGAMLLVRRG